MLDDLERDGWELTEAVGGSLGVQGHWICRVLQRVV